MKRLEVDDETHAQIKYWSRHYKMPIRRVVAKLVGMAENTDFAACADKEGAA